jgi:hypothetical protein
MSVARGDAARADSTVRCGRLLRWSLGALDRPAPPPCTATELPELAERAELHRVAPLLHLAADRLDLEEEAASRLRSAYHAAVHRHLFVLDDLTWLRQVLEPLDAPWLVIKGPVLSETVYRRPDHRAYGDLDVVVPGDRFGNCVELLRTAGARLLAADWDQVVVDRHGELQLELPSSTVLDLHWHLVPIGRVRDRFTIAMPDVFTSARVVELGGGSYRTLSMAHTINHIALHAVLSGGHRLGWVKDLEQAVVNQEVDWSAVVAVARRWHAEPALALQLRRVAQLVGGRPDAGLDRLRRGCGWSSLVRAADRWQPIECWMGDRSVSRLLAWSTAGSTGRSLVALAGVPARWAAERAHRPRVADGTGVRSAGEAPPAERWRALLAVASADR